MIELRQLFNKLTVVLLVLYSLAHLLAAAGLIAFGLRAGGYPLNHWGIYGYGAAALVALVLSLSELRRHEEDPSPLQLTLPPLLVLWAAGLYFTTDVLGAEFAPWLDDDGLFAMLNLTFALVNDPELVFLDELTTGLDPHARRAMWDLVRDIRDQGKTVFFTTHYMEEAERLCDRALIDYGKIVALDTPEELIQSLDAENRVLFVAEEGFDPKPLRALSGVARVEQIGERVIVYGKGERLVGEVVNTLEAQRVRFRDLRTEQPNLEDAFLALTGREIRD